ncbi:peptidase S1, partial [Micromonospora sp. NPDC049559]
WDRTRTTTGTWTDSTNIDDNGFVIAVSAAGLPDGTLHVLTLDPGTGLWDRTRAAGGAWGGAANVDRNGSIFAADAAALPDGTLHVLTVPDLA